MKKILVLFTFFCASIAYGKNNNVSVSVDYNGSLADIEIVEKKATYTCRLAADGDIETLTTIRAKNDQHDTRIDCRAYFIDRKAHSIDYTVFKGFEIVSKSYYRNKHKKLFRKIHKITARLYEQYDLKNLAKEECKKKKEKYLKQEEEKKRKEEEKRKRMPSLESVLDELLK